MLEGSGRLRISSCSGMRINIIDIIININVNIYISINIIIYIDININAFASLRLPLSTIMPIY